jgi:cytochrome d ubiquinol oxidase subunit II
VFFLLTTIYTLVSIPRAVPNFENAPWSLGVVLLLVFAVANIPRAIYKGSPGQAFLSSCVLILALVGLFGMAMWPNLVTASNHSEWSLTIYRAASSPKTLKIMLVIAALGIPLVLSYTGIVYWTFRRRVVIGKHSY